jgi:hypothetical protein
MFALAGGASPGRAAGEADHSVSESVSFFVSLWLRGKDDREKVMDKEILVRLDASFEDLVRKFSETGTEFWCAGDLKMLLTEERTAEPGLHCSPKRI